MPSSTLTHATRRSLTRARPISTASSRRLAVMYSQQCCVSDIIRGLSGFRSWLHHHDSGRRRLSTLGRVHRFSTARCEPLRGLSIRPEAHELEVLSELVPHLSFVVAALGGTPVSSRSCGRLSVARVAVAPA